MRRSYPLPESEGSYPHLVAMIYDYNNHVGRCPTHIYYHPSQVPDKVSSVGMFIHSDEKVVPGTVELAEE